ncbi:SusC/RagA family TonB-linked outer membrane protein [Pararcticibacter amylolyticus]|nr:SusC/RagA family TonB-linked outer membrane protein [Pararcticibacter amylolyticus]
MKLIAVILIGSLIQVSAAAVAQKVTIRENNITLSRLFKEIGKQTGFSVVWSDAKVMNTERVSVNLKNIPLEEALSKVLGTQPLDYEIDGKTIIIKEKSKTVLEKISSFFQGDSTLYHGRVLDERGEPLSGATIKLKGATKASVSRGDGYFERYGTPRGTIIITYVGYQTREISLAGRNPGEQIVIKMLPGQSQLGEVTVVSTGYQDIPKERATGSFEVITKEQLQHNTNPNLLKRLEGITTGMDFRNDLYRVNSSAQNPNTNPPLLSRLTIRGKNTLTKASPGTNTDMNTSGYPLVVIDGIPRENPRDIEMLNPDDVESINVLRDAAAASIWGARAANGVLVIKTKQGAVNRPARFTFSGNADITDKLDMFYKKRMSISDYVDAQIYSYQYRYPDVVGEPNLTNAQPTLSPVAEILNYTRMMRTQQLSDNEKAALRADSAAQIDALRRNDLRNDYSQYLLRNAVNQRYNLAIDGGTSALAYRVSAGYVNSVANTDGSGANSLALSYNTNVRLLKNLTLDVNTSLLNSNSKTQSLNNTLSLNSIQKPFYPYSRLADDNGNPVEVTNLYRPSFVDLLENTYGNKILSMRWFPLEDYKAGYNKTSFYSLNLNATANYHINDALTAGLTYGYNRGWNSYINFDSKDSYFMRERINRFTDPGTFDRPIPVGGLYVPNSANSEKQILRGLFTFNKSWNEKHAINAVAGFDIDQYKGRNWSDFYYGYDEDRLKQDNAVLQFNTVFPYLFADENYTPASQIPILAKGYYETITRTYDLFSNVAYTFLQRYSLSGSARKDASSAFGLNTNKKGNPFYSLGAAWIINNEPFYKLSWLPSLKIRTTYGYNGNTNPRVTANPYINNYNPYKGTNQLYYATLTTDVITNGKLRPERTGMFNAGLDFAFRDNRFSGSIEYYDKQTKDLITSNLVDPSLGKNRLTFNTGDLHGYGIDANLNSVNLRTEKMQWTSSLYFSYNRTKVKKLYTTAPQTANNAVGPGVANFFTEGYDINRLFAWKWAGLDPETGYPRVFLNGQTVTVTGTDNSVINMLHDAPISELRYMGSAVPIYYGSFRNTFTYGSLMLAVGIQYKFHYFAQRSNFDIANYYYLLRYDVQAGAEFANRWKQRGDEAFTNVPSMVYDSGMSNRDSFYQQADINVYKADHIRLQEVQLNYTFKNIGKKAYLKTPRIFMNVNNLGIIWRANKLGLDPDTFDYPQPRTYSFGFSTSF